MKRNKFMIAILAILLVLTTGFGVVVMANDNNPLWRNWTGKSELDEVELLVEELVGDIVELDGQVITLTTELEDANSDITAINIQANLWLESEGLLSPYLEADINEDSEVTTIEKLVYYEEVLRENGAAGHAELLDQVALLTVQVSTLTQTITDLEDEILGLQTQIFTLQTQLAETTAELEHLRAELDQANAEAIQFKTNICTAIDELPQGTYENGNYASYCTP